MPLTSLRCLVKDVKFGSLEETYLFCLPIKESEIIEVFLGSSFKDEVLKIMPMQKQTHADRQTRFKTFVAIGDSVLNVPVRWPLTSVGPSCWPRSLAPVQQGLWENEISKLHTVPCKVTGRCSSVLWHHVPGPGAPVLCGLLDLRRPLQGHPGQLRQGHLGCHLQDLELSHADLWKETTFSEAPSQELTDHPVKTHTGGSVQQIQAPAVVTM